MGVRLAACRCTAGGTSPEHVHGGGGQAQGSRLMSLHLYRGWGWLPVQSRALAGRKEKEQGETQAAE